MSTLRTNETNYVCEQSGHIIFVTCKALAILLLTSLSVLWRSYEQRRETLS